MRWQGPATRSREALIKSRDARCGSGRAPPLTSQAKLASAATGCCTLCQVQMDARRRAAAKVGTLAKRATRQTLHLAQPDQFAPLLRDRSAFVPNEVSLFYTQDRCKAQTRSGRAGET